MHTNIILVLFNDLELHPIIHPKHQWLMTTKELARALNLELVDLINLKANNEDRFIEDKHYLYSQVKTCDYSNGAEMFLWSKKGILRVVYMLKSDIAMEFLDFIEDIQVDCGNKVDENMQDMFDAVEEILEDKLAKMHKSNKYNPEELQSMLSIMDQFIEKKKRAYGIEDSNKTDSPFGGLGKLLNLDQEKIGDSVSSFLKDTFNDTMNQSATRYEKMQKIKEERLNKDEKSKS